MTANKIATITENAESRPTRPTIQVARFSLRAEPLPSVLVALPFGESVRAALSRCRVGTSYSAALCGKTPHGVPLAGHQHAHFWATDDDADGLLDHLTIYAPCGFNSEDVAALQQLHSVRRPGNELHIGLRLQRLGRPEHFATLPLFGTARWWCSVTPFSLPRFATRGAGKPPRPRDLPAAQLRRALNQRGFPEPVRVTLTDGYETVRRRKLSWLEFHTRRLRKPSDTYGMAEGFGLAGFEIEFPYAVRGPIAVGFGAHFGLGLFQPVE